jgi:hypothetical protein
MNTPHHSFHQVLQYVFPVEVLEHFIITNTQEITPADSEDSRLEITLEEINAPPTIPIEYKGSIIHSNGFHRIQLIQHFPLQDKLCLLKVKRRRWTVEGMGTLTRELSFLPKEGLKVTTAFGSFLKEADRTRAGRSRTHRETLWSEEIGENI